MGMMTIILKVRPNARNISTQHLATLLDRVVRCREGADQTRATSATSKNVVTKI